VLEQAIGKLGFIRLTTVLAMGLTPKRHFVLGLLNESPEIPKVQTLATLGAHNFVFELLIEMRS
jgi:hypothetical protein